LMQPLTVDNVCRELARYCPRDAAEVSERIRAKAPLTLATDRLLDLYHTVIEEHAANPVDPTADLAAMAAYFEAIRSPLERGTRNGAWQQSSRVLRRAAAMPARWLQRRF